MIKHLAITDSEVLRAAGFHPPTMDAAWFVMSTPAPDRHDDIVEQSWDLKEFNDNPIAVVDHWASASNVIGSWSDVEVRGGKLTGRLVWSKTEDAQEIAQKVVEGHIRAVSVGFRPRNALERKSLPDTDPRKGLRGSVFQGPNLLLECSVVGIPANTGALVIRNSGVDLGGLVDAVSARVLTGVEQKLTELASSFFTQRLEQSIRDESSFPGSPPVDECRVSDLEDFFAEKNSLDAFFASKENK